jgi:hypothetical protein
VSYDGHAGQAGSRKEELGKEKVESGKWKVERVKLVPST